MLGLAPRWARASIRIGAGSREARPRSMQMAPLFAPLGREGIVQMDVPGQSFGGPATHRALPVKPDHRVGTDRNFLLLRRETSGTSFLGDKATTASRLQRADVAIQAARIVAAISDVRPPSHSILSLEIFSSGTPTKLFARRERGLDWIHLLMSISSNFPLSQVWMISKSSLPTFLIA